MALQISSGDIDCTHKIGVPNKGKNKPIIAMFVRYVDRRQAFTKKKRLKRKDIKLN